MISFSVARFRPFAVAIAMLVVVAACGGDSTGPKTTVSGNWTGNAMTVNGSPFTVGLVLTENTGTVTGTATLTGATSIALTVTGSYSAPTVGLTMAAPGFSSLNLTATVSGKSMTGTLNGSGFTNTAITLTKP
jgi:hypothetical protein